MLIDMTQFGQFATPNFPLSDYKVAYFRIPQWDKVKDGLISGQPPVLEICLIPFDKDIKSFDNDRRDLVAGSQKEQAFVIPPDALIIKVRAGDQWPDINEIKKATDKQREQLRLAEMEYGD